MVGSLFGPEFGPKFTKVFPDPLGDAFTGLVTGRQSVGRAVKGLTPLAQFSTKGGRRGVKGFLASNAPAATPLRKQLLGNK